MTNIKNRKVLVVGLGTSGIASAKFLQARGAKVKCTDIADTEQLQTQKNILERLGIEVELGKHSADFYQDAEMIVLSPGVPPDVEPILWAEKNDIPAISEIELGYEFCSNPIIAVTGTNGKTTATNLINQILNQAGVQSSVAGNIGIPLIERIQNTSGDVVIVAEISSFQLERIINFKPFISIILNITADHLDRHCTIEKYIDAKMRIFKNQNHNDYAIFNENLRETAQSHLQEKSPRFLFFGKNEKCDIRYDDQQIISRVNGREEVYHFQPHYSLCGSHNIENLAAAITVAEIYNLEKESIYSSIEKFKSLEHRLEFVDEIDGRKFYNDSKATNVDAVIKALNAFNKNIILIAGGRDKGGDFYLLRDEVKKKVRFLVLIGEASAKLRAALENSTKISQADTLEQAVELAYLNSIKDDVILLSPACTSFDMFKNFEERGDAFKKKVAELKDKYLLNSNCRISGSIEIF